MNRRLHRPKGQPLLVCDCAGEEGWPLFVRRLRTFGDNRGRGFTATWQDVIGFRFDERTHQRIFGTCPNCGRDFVIETSVWLDDCHQSFCHMIENVSDAIHIKPLRNEKEPHVRIIRDWNPFLWYHHIKGLPSRTRTHNLLCDSNVKTTLVELLTYALSGELPQEKYPDWQPSGSEEDFSEWTRQLQQELTMWIDLQETASPVG